MGVGALACARSCHFFDVILGEIIPAIRYRVLGSMVRAQHQN